MSSPLLSVTVKTNVTAQTDEILDAMAKARGPGIKKTQIIREAIEAHILAHGPKTPKKK